jgi:hypothetical protein
MTLRLFKGQMQYGFDDSDGRLHMVIQAGDGTITDLGPISYAPTTGPGKGNSGTTTSDAAITLIAPTAGGFSMLSLYVADAEGWFSFNSGTDWCGPFPPGVPWPMFPQTVLETDSIKFKRTPSGSNATGYCFAR